MSTRIEFQRPVIHPVIPVCDLIRCCKGGVIEDARAIYAGSSHLRHLGEIRPPIRTALFHRIQAALLRAVPFDPSTRFESRRLAFRSSASRVALSPRPARLMK